MTDVKEVITITAKDLKQYAQLKNEIKDIETELSEFRTEETKDVVKASLNHFPYTEHSLTVNGCCELSNEARNKLITQKQFKKAELEQLRIDIEQFIDNIDDSQIRRIIRLKYIKGYSWAKVAKSVGNNTADSVRKTFERFFQKI